MRGHITDGRPELNLSVLQVSFADNHGFLQILQAAFDVPHCVGNRVFNDRNFCIAVLKPKFQTVLAKENGIPFYVAAPMSTIDFSIPSGDYIPVEERDSEEITRIRGVQIAPEGVETANPAFDVTPNRYISAIITEKGIARDSYIEMLKGLYDKPG